MNYLDFVDPVGFPQNKHLHRLEGVGQKSGRREQHVDYSERPTDFDRTNLVALQHIELVDHWLLKHKRMIRRKYIT
jgi:hypothetical protein